MKFEDIIEALSSLGRRATDPMIAEVALLYYGSILFNRYGLKKDIDFLKSFVNMYVMIFGSSSSGKDFTINNTEKICQLEEYPDQMETMYNFFIEQLDGQKIDPEILRFMPTSITTSLDGSKEGLTSIARAVSESGFGSLSLVHTELLDIVTSSNELIQTLKLAYDGTLKAKVIKGVQGDSRAKDVSNIVVNMLGAGSRDALDKETQKALSNLAKTGMYRRSFIVDSKMEPQRKTVEEIDLKPIYAWFKKLNDVNKNDFNNRIDRFNQFGTLDKIFPIDKDALEYVELIDDNLMDRSRKDKLNRFYAYDVGATNSIVNAGYIIAYIEMAKSVSVEHLKKAFSIFMRTRETTLDTFKEVKPHQEIYDLLKMKPNLTQSELMDISSCDCIPKAKGAFNDTMLLVQELAYRNNEELVRNEGIVVRFSIKPLPKTNLDQLIMSWSTDGKYEKAIAYEQILAKWDDIPMVVTSNYREELDEETGDIEIVGIDSFTLAHYDTSTKTDPYGHRRLESFIQGQNLIAFDFDGTTSIEDALIIFQGHKLLLYTTKSHQTIKRNYKDSFRIILPTKNKFYVTPEQHKQMYRNIIEYMQIDSDPVAINVSRVWFNSPNGEVTVEDGELFDVSPYLPDTNKNDTLKEMILKVKNSEYITDDMQDEADRRINGMFKYCVANIGVGNLKDSLFKLAMLVKDLTGDNGRAISELEKLRSILNYPQKFNDDVIHAHLGGN